MSKPKTPKTSKRCRCHTCKRVRVCRGFPCDAPVSWSCEACCQAYLEQNLQTNSFCLRFYGSIPSRP